MTDINKKQSARSRKRASTPRSKTGCITCKIRRLKCGEEKPYCHRCLKSGWHCDGYNHVPKLPLVTSTTLVPIRPRSIISIPSSILSLQDPLLSLDLSLEELQYFQNFVEEGSMNLQGNDTFFWRGVVLQESQTNFSVRHAIVAISALARSTQRTMCGSHRMDTNNGTHREFALHQYEKAIQGLRGSMLSADLDNSLRTTLICCIVLAFFDNFTGNSGFALHHIRHAREVLLNSKVILPATLGAHPSEQDQLLNMFLRLDMQALCAMGIEENRTFATLLPHTPDLTLPTHFTSIEEAKNVRNTLVWEGYNFFYLAAQYRASSPEEIPASIQNLRDFVIAQLHSLHGLLDDLTSHLEPEYTCHPLSRPESLKLYSTVLLIRLTSSLCAPETACDALLPCFEFLLDISRETLEFEAHGDPNILEAETFTPEVRTIAPLLLTATKCRDPPIRRSAISLLLSSHRREWMYDSLLAGRIGEWMMELEEEGVDELGYVPEESRAWGETVELDLQRRKARLRCRVGVGVGDGMEGMFGERGSDGGKATWRWREKDLYW